MSSSTPGSLLPNDVAQYFPSCPFCHTNASMGFSSEGNFISCAKCGSKWAARLSKSANVIARMKLVKMGTDERGILVADKLSWVDVNRPPEFWRQRSLGLTEPVDTHIRCPRCGANMRWIRRVNTYICDNDGYLLGKEDPYLLKGEVIPAHNPGGQYNH